MRFRSQSVCAVLGAGLCLALAVAAKAHPGRLAADGCHNERRAGTCHCHRLDAARPGCSAAALRGAHDLQRPTADANNARSSRYHRADWLPRWADADGDCQSTRHEVLIAESRVPVTLSASRCQVQRGEWLDPYTGRLYTNPRELDIDHLVPLAEAHRSGGAAWSQRRKRAFANDLRFDATLVAVSRSENRSKGARDPARWVPRNNPRAICAYLRDWVQVKARWALEMDAAERQAIARHSQQSGCADIAILTPGGP